jgi:hypothetical protein
MPPATSHIIDVWAHLAAQREDVLAMAQVEAGPKPVAIRSEGPFEVTKGTVLTVRLSIEDLAIEPLEKSILWQGQIGKAGFFVSFPENAAKGSRQGVVTLLIDGVPLAKMLFVVEIGDNAGKVERLPVQEKRYRKAFISYAAKDKDAVLARIQGIRKGAPNLDVFWPPADIESGSRWQDVLAKEILDRDVMYLFWSEAASHLKWVDWEWRYAFKNRGIGFIDPCPLVPPEKAPPPKELADHLHFNDWALAYMTAYDTTRGLFGPAAKVSGSIRAAISSVFRQFSRKRR